MKFTCKNCGNTFVKYRTTDKCRCSLKSKKTTPKKPINKVSQKRKKINLIYSKLRIDYLSRPENQICFIEGCNNSATTIEHRRGRIGFADDWAKENNVPLVVDERFFAPCCLKHNLELENNSELSKKYQLSKIHGGEKN